MIVALGCWYFTNTVAINDSMVSGIATGAIPVMFAFGLVVIVGGMFHVGRRK